MTPGNVYEVKINMWSTCYFFNKGHKIRIDISSSNYPRFSANPNNGLLLNQGLCVVKVWSNGCRGSFGRCTEYYLFGQESSIKSDIAYCYSNVIKRCVDKIFYLNKMNSLFQLCVYFPPIPSIQFALIIY